MGLNVERIRRDFPILARPDPPVYLDSACMSLKPQSVIDATVRYYEDTPFCAGRSVYDGARSVERAVEDARAALAHLLGADPAGVVWTKNATEAVNLVAAAFPFRPGDVVLAGDREHNSNLVPWLAQRARGVRVDVLPSRDDGAFDLDALVKRLGAGDVRLVAIGHASNLDGAVAPAREIVAAAHAAGARVLLDGAQAAPHHPVDLAAIGCDYYAVSLHKMLGPTGVGALLARREALDALGPFLVGGETVASSTYDGFELLEPPARFEAGLQNYAGLAAVPAAVRYLADAGPAVIEAHERALTERLDAALADVPGVRLLGPPAGSRGGITSFTTDFLDPHELAILLDDKHRILVRSGDHCAHSWFNARGLAGSVRASLYLYSSREEVDALADAVRALSRRLR